MISARLIPLLLVLLLPAAGRSRAVAPLDRAQALDRRQSAHFVLAAPRGEDLTRIVDALERAYRAVRSYGVTMPNKVEARLYGSTPEFVRGSRGSAYNLAVYSGGIIHLQPVRLLTRTGELDRALMHELTHAGFGMAAAGRLPMWLNEGMAMVVAGESQPESVKFGRLRQLEDTLLRSSSYRNVRSAYGTAARLTRRLIGAHGKGKVLAMMRGVVEGENFERRFRTLTGSSPEEWGTAALSAKVGR